MTDLFQSAQLAKLHHFPFDMERKTVILKSWYERRRSNPRTVFVGASPDVDLDDCDSRVGYLLSASRSEDGWCVPWTTRKVCESDSLSPRPSPLDSFCLRPALRSATESRH